MKLPAIAVALLGGSVAAAAAASEQQLLRSASIDADSVHAHRLLSSANTRALANNNGEEDTTWMVNYALRFDSCHEIAAVGGEAGGREEGDGSGVQRLVKLKLCPKDTCGGSCRNGAGEFFIYICIYLMQDALIAMAAALLLVAHLNILIIFHIYHAHIILS